MVSSRFPKQHRSPIQVPLQSLVLSRQAQVIPIDSFESPRLQISLALVLYEQLKTQILSVEVFDPIISATERAAMEELGITVMGIDEHGARKVKAPTLFFMLHCEVQLYDKLLDANWGSESLNRMVILGNSFGEYKRYVEGRRRLGGGGSLKGEEVGRRVIRSRRFFREVGVEGGVDGKDGFFKAFHDISWHFFNVGNYAAMNFV